VFCSSCRQALVVLMSSFRDVGLGYDDIS